MKCCLSFALLLSLFTGSCASNLGSRAAEADAGAQFLKGLQAEDEGQDAVAAEWYRLAAEQGHAAAQNNLGLMHFEGRGVWKSYSEAACWYEASAHQGFAKAQSNLAVLKYFGLGTERNPEEATTLLMLAHGKGHQQAAYSMAMFNLGPSPEPTLASQALEQKMRVTLIR